MNQGQYRQSIRAVIIDSDDKLLVVQLNEYNDDEWKFLGGGIDKGESPKETLWREIKEEINLDRKDFELIAKPDITESYEYPEPKIDEGTEYIGQIKIPFILRFQGDKNQIALQEEELKDYKWINSSAIENHLIFPGQAEFARKLIEEHLNDEV